MWLGQAGDGVCLLCVWRSCHDGALGHWHGNSLAITPAARRSDWSAMWGNGSFDIPTGMSGKWVFVLSRLPPESPEGRGERQCSVNQCSGPMFSLYMSCSFCLYFSPFFFLTFQSATPSSLLFLPLLSSQLVKSLSPCLSGSHTFTLLLLVLSPPPRKVKSLFSVRRPALHKHSSNPAALSAVSFWNSLLFECRPFEENALCITLIHSLNTHSCIYTQTQTHSLISIFRKKISHAHIEMH